MNKTDLAYMAGFFDGEGCIVIGFRLMHNCISYRLCVDIGQIGKTGKEILNLFHDNFKGKVNLIKRRYNQRSYYKWSSHCRQTYQFLKQIYPYVKVKRKQVQLAIEFQELLMNGKTHWLSESEKIEKHSYRETVKQEISFLNNKHKFENLGE